MGRHELLEALQREGQEKLATITAQKAAAEERLRAATVARRAEMQREHEEERELLCSARQRQLLAKAGREAALLRLRAEHALALRLHERARNLLPQLREHDAASLFQKLAAELPSLPWQTIWTTPDATAAATALFPDATIIADPSLAGGIKAALAGNALTVDNTLETRLEKLWPDLLPQLLAALREEQL
jgi:vacuolar-type H+-ATPase subunit E/Vma4